MLKNYWAILNKEDNSDLQMKIYDLRSSIGVANAVRYCAGVLCFFLGFGSHAQVTTKLDATTIKIGEELRYTITVAADTTNAVVFPEGETFKPLEVIASYAIDTTKKTKGYVLTKEYGLTQFDSGQYTIPRQEVLIGSRKAYSDSLAVVVNDVVVDTTKQKLYEIKPMVDVVVEDSGTNNYLWWLIPIVLVLLGLGAFLWFRKKKKQEAKEDEIPPYERAMQALQQIDASDLLAQDSHKEYYSKLSDTARKYIDEELYDRAMESTTDELIEYLQQQAKFGTLDLDTETITALEEVLKTADMAKFAKSKPNIDTAKGDRNVIEDVIHKTKEAIPEPTAEELMADEEFRRIAEEKAKKKKLRLLILGGVGVVLLAIAIFVGVKGVDGVKKMIVGDIDAKIEAIDWVSSSYGFPPITMRTPAVLIRNNYKTTKAQKEALQKAENFSAGSLTSDLYTTLATVQFKEKTEVDLQKAVESVVGSFEQQGARNIIVKTEEYETLGGAKGIKVFGTLEIPEEGSDAVLKKEYKMLNFAEYGGFQQITVVYAIDNEYVQKIAERIINAVEFNTEQE